jgi:ATP-binding cassette subfamily C protein
VRFSHGGHEVLKGASMTIRAGEMVVMTGPSGTGKTTLVDLILGLYRPQSGEILIDGVSLTEIDLKSWRSLVGYVPQELVLFHDTIRANLTLGDDAVSDEALHTALEAAGALGFINDLPQRLETVVGEKGSKLSGGQRQRIALARALALRPRLLILDEVTSALDPRTAADITRNIRAFGQNLTILSITHRSEFLDLADRVYHLEDGLALEDRLAAAASLRGPAVA